MRRWQAARTKPGSKSKRELSVLGRGDRSQFNGGRAAALRSGGGGAAESESRGNGAPAPVTLRQPAILRTAASEFEIGEDGARGGGRVPEILACLCCCSGAAATQETRSITATAAASHRVRSLAIGLDDPAAGAQQQELAESSGQRSLSLLLRSCSRAAAAAAAVEDVCVWRPSGSEAKRLQGQLESRLFGRPPSLPCFYHRWLAR